MATCVSSQTVGFLGSIATPNLLETNRTNTIANIYIYILIYVHRFKPISVNIYRSNKCTLTCVNIHLSICKHVFIYLYLYLLYFSMLLVNTLPFWCRSRFVRARRNSTKTSWRMSSRTSPKPSWRMSRR